MTVSKGKRPRDQNQLAKWIVDQSTGQNPIQEQEPKPDSAVPAPANLSEC